MRGGWMHCSVIQSSGQAYGLEPANCAPMHLTLPLQGATLATELSMPMLLYVLVPGYNIMHLLSGFLSQIDRWILTTEGVHLPSFRACLPHWRLMFNITIVSLAHISTCDPRFILLSFSGFSIYLSSAFLADVADPCV